MTIMERSDYYVYCYFRPDTGEPCYIGKGRGRRWRDHLLTTKRGNERLRRIIIKAGGEIPHVKLHAGLTDEKAKEYEIALIKAIGRGKNGPLVNFTDGGEGMEGWVPTDETRAKMREKSALRSDLHSTLSKARASRSPEGRARCVAAMHAALTPEVYAKAGASRRGMKMSPEAIAKTRAANIGKELSPETRAKISASLTGRKQSPEHLAKNRDRTCSPETRAKISAANKGKIISLKTRAKIAAAKIGRTLAPEIRAARLAKLTSTTHVDERP